MHWTIGLRHPRPIIQPNVDLLDRVRLPDLRNAKAALLDTGERFSHLIFDNLLVDAPAVRIAASSSGILRILVLRWSDLFGIGEKSQPKECQPESAVMTEYFVKRGEKTHGPFSVSQLQAGLRSKKLSSKDLTSDNRSGPWSSIFEVVEQPNQLQAANKNLIEALEFPEAQLLATQAQIPHPTRKEPFRSGSENLASNLENTKLSSCPDCDGKVSKRASSCPHCGSPLGGPEMLPDLNALGEIESLAIPSQQFPSPEGPGSSEAPPKASRKAKKNKGVSKGFLFVVTPLLLLIIVLVGTAIQINFIRPWINDYTNSDLKEKATEMAKSTLVYESTFELIDVNDIVGEDTVFITVSYSGKNGFNVPVEFSRTFEFDRDSRRVIK